MGKVSDPRGQPRPNIICLERVANFKADGAVGDGISFSIVGDHDNRPTDMTNVIVITKDEGDNITGESSRRFKNKD